MQCFGSYDENGKLNYNKLKEELEKIEGEVTIKDTNGGFPITVTVDGYSFIINGNGDIEPVRSGPTVDESSIKITLKEGGEIPTDGVDEGTELKITFTASIEEGTITNVTPGTVQNGQIIYITEGTEKEVTFKITGKVGNDTYETSYTVPLKKYYKKIVVEASNITKEPNTFYGAEVTEYSCPSEGVSKWRIFYADSSNIYLIADDYIEYAKVPDGQAGSKLYKGTTNYKVSFNKVYEDYTGSAWILGKHTDTDGKVVENSLAKKWLNKYFNYTPDNGTTYPNRTSVNNNIRSLAYMMDTTVWSTMYKGEQAEYAIGGPPLEMYCESYTQTHPNNSMSCSVTRTNGYFVSKNGDISSDCDEIYTKPDTTKAGGMWLVAPSYYGSGEHIFTTGGKNFGNMYFYQVSSPGFRPIVCLNSGVRLEKTGDRIYKIQ